MDREGQNLQRELGRLEGRLELTERAESALREDLLRERSERREAQEEARRLREELEAPSKHDQSSAAPSALRGAWEEGAKEIARRLVAGIAGVVVFIPSALTAVISYFNNATTLAVLTGLLAFFATVTGLVGTYFGIKAASHASERARRVPEVLAA